MNTGGGIGNAQSSKPHNNNTTTTSNNTNNPAKHESYSKPGANTANSTIGWNNSSLNNSLAISSQRQGAMQLDKYLRNLTFETFSVLRNYPQHLEMRELSHTLEQSIIWQCLGHAHLAIQFYESLRGINETASASSTTSNVTSAVNNAGGNKASNNTNATTPGDEKQHKKIASSPLAAASYTVEDEEGSHAFEANHLKKGAGEAGGGAAADDVLYLPSGNEWGHDDLLKAAARLAARASQSPWLDPNGVLKIGIIGLGNIGKRLLGALLKVLPTMMGPRTLVHIQVSTRRPELHSDLMQQYPLSNVYISSQVGAAAANFAQSFINNSGNVKTGSTISTIHSYGSDSSLKHSQRSAGNPGIAVSVFFDNEAVASNCALIYLCITPSHLPRVEDELTHCLGKSALLVSILAGTALKRLQRHMKSTAIVKPFLTRTHLSEKPSSSKVKKNQFKVLYRPPISVNDFVQKHLLPSWTPNSDGSASEAAALDSSFPLGTFFNNLHSAYFSIIRKINHLHKHMPINKMIEGLEFALYGIYTNEGIHETLVKAYRAFEVGKEERKLKESVSDPEIVAPEYNTVDEPEVEIRRKAKAAPKIFVHLSEDLIASSSSGSLLVKSGGVEDAGVPADDAAAKDGESKKVEARNLENASKTDPLTNVSIELSICYEPFKLNYLNGLKDLSINQYI